LTYITNFDIINSNQKAAAKAPIIWEVLMGTVVQNRGKKTRDSGIELLRIILMLQVIFLHVCTYGGYYDTATEIGGSVEFIHRIIWLCCRCPVYVYIVVFGYFSVTSNKTLGSIKGKILKMYLPMYFYSVAIPFLGELFGLWTQTSTELFSRSPQKSGTS